MSIVIGPTYTHTPGFPGGFGLTSSVLDFPVNVVALAPAITGEPEVFDAGAPPHDLTIPIPHLPGLDEIELTSASFSIASAPYPRAQSVSAGSPPGGAVAITLGGVAPGQSVTLTGIELSGLTLTPPAGVTYALQGSGGTVYWTLDGSDVVSSTSNPGGNVQHLHILVRPGTGNGAGPPIVAAPHFNMPGAGAGLYGPALGGGRLSLSNKGDGRADVLLTLSPPQPMSACTVLVGTAGESGAHGGLPTDVATVDWSANGVEARFDTRAQNITVTTHAGATAPEDGALVATFETDPGALLRAVDFAPAARVALDQGYPTASGDDLGLTMRVAVATPGALHLQLGSVAARYIQRPLPLPAALSLRGAPETVEIPLPQGLRPLGLSFRADGRYGPARLIAGADATPLAATEGYRVAGSQRMARRITLNPRETTLPLVRLALFGRASAAGELLITRHGGDATRIGPPLGPPVSLPVTPAPAPRWHRAAIPLRDGLPPQAGAFWLSVQATKGVFWWHADMDPTTPEAQISTDQGTTWAKVSGRPYAQAWVNEVDPVTGDPAPLSPLALGWQNGVLNADIVGVGAGPMAPEFTRLWVAEGRANAAFLDGIAQLSGKLALSLTSTRDMELSLSDVVATYDPWTAEGSP